MSFPLDDFRLPPILDDATVWDNTWDDLFTLELPPLQDTSPTKLYNHEAFEADNITPTKSSKIDPKHTIVPPEKKQGHGIQRSTAPLAEVLNEEDIITARPNQIQKPSTDARSPTRKRGRIDHDIDWTGSLYLPQPLPNRSYEPQFPPIPPLLQGLHEPPPTAGLFPRITDKPSPTLLGYPSISQLPTRIGSHQHVPDRPRPPAWPEFEAPSRIDLRQEKAPVSVKINESAITKPAKGTVSVNSEAKHTSSRRSQAARSRGKWTEQESRDLREGVQKYGVGNWKKILHDSNFSFCSRSAVDLKDHHRVLLIREHKSKTNQKSNSQENISFKLSKPNIAINNRDNTVESTMGVERQQSDPKDNDESCKDCTTRRPRTIFTKTEDQALLTGFERHGNAWAKIRHDNDLNLRHRQPRDLRDRMRHKWPEKYERPGLKRRKPKKKAKDKHGNVAVAKKTNGLETRAANTNLVVPAPLEQTTRTVHPLAMWKI